MPEVVYEMETATWSPQQHLYQHLHTIIIETPATHSVAIRATQFQADTSISAKYTSGTQRIPNRHLAIAHSKFPAGVQERWLCSEGRMGRGADPHLQVAAAVHAAGAGVGGLAQLVAQRRQLGLLRREQRLQLRRFALRRRRKCISFWNGHARLCSTLLTG